MIKLGFGIIDGHQQKKLGVNVEFTIWSCSSLKLVTMAKKVTKIEDKKWLWNKLMSCSGSISLNMASSFS